MGDLFAPQHLILLLIVFLGISFFFYWLGKRSGYKQGQLDMYKKMDDDRRNKI
jgi:cbb3-type cytochrome oxidase subunit 3